MNEFVEKSLMCIDSISDWTGKTVSFLIPTLAFIEVYEVIARYGFNRPTIWVNELSAMLFGAFTLYYRGHVNMDILYVLLPQRARAFLNLVTFLLFLAFVGVLLWKGWDIAWKSLCILEHDSTEWAPPLYYFKLTLPVGAFLLLLQGLANFVRDLVIVIKSDVS